MVGIKYDFVAKPWQYNGPSSWTFISLPENIAKEIRRNFKSEEKGWGRLNVTAKIGRTIWKTAVWYDTKMNTYILPLKAEVRIKESVDVDKKLSASIRI